MSQKHSGKESVIQRRIFEFLDREVGAKVWINTPSTIDNKSYTAQGIPDITGVLPGGKHLAVEVKRNKSGRVSAQQKNHLVITAALGGEAWVVYEENFEEFKEYIAARYKPASDVRGAALIESIGLSTAKSGDIPAHKVHDYLGKL